MGGLADPALAVYVHWPFCRSKCPYCDFNSHVRDAIDEHRWRSALVREIGHFAKETAGAVVSSVAFGGGTPSLMAPATVAAVIDAVAGAWNLAADAEITLEANPTSSEADRFAAYRAAGVNRLSLGVQALDDNALAALGRTHTAAEARHAVAAAAAVFPRMSFDLIYGRPRQDVAAWRQELDAALDIAGDHLSAYQLIIEPGTSFHSQGIRPADEETAAAMFEATQEVLEGAGMPAYEVSNHARAGEACRHNVAIWRGGAYVGVGPGAHGRLIAAQGTLATYQQRSPEAWLAAVEAHGHGTAERVVLSPVERRQELVMMGLRLTDGIDRMAFRAQAGIEPDKAVDRETLDWLAEGGLIERDAQGLRATPAGRQCLDAVLARLLA